MTLARNAPHNNTVRDGSALLAEQQYQQETVTAPDQVDDDRTLLAVFGKVAKEYITQQAVCVCLQSSRMMARSVFLTWHTFTE